MSIAEQVASLEALVAVDAAIRLLTEQLAKEKSSLDGINAELLEVEGQVARDRESVAEMEKTKQELLTELRQIDKQLERSRDRLGRARTERESNAAEREVEELRKLARDRDEEIKRVVSLVDQARASVTQDEARVAELQQKLANSGLVGGSGGPAVQAELAARQKERSEIAAKLPTRLFRRYESLIGRRAVPVAKTHDGTCLGCHIGLPPAMFQDMRSHARFDECPHCHRIIYYEAPSADAEEGT